MIIKNGTVYTMDGRVFDRGFVRAEGKRVLACGCMNELPAFEGEETIDAAGGFILPGLIDCHSHMGVFENAIGFEGDDGNEDTDPCMPQLRAIDAVNPLDKCFDEALSAGITTVLTGPGSANPIGGQFAAIKTFGRRIDDMIIRAPISMKFALGENPKTVYHGKGETPVTRMATAAIMRDNLFKAREYMDKKAEAAADREKDRPDFDLKLESLIPLLKGDISAHFHAHRADDIFTAIRIAKEFNLRYAIIHGTEGHLIGDILAAEGAKVITGPALIERSKPELANLTFSAPGALAEAGVLTAICTDHPETPIQYLALCAALAVKSGMREMDALSAITINAAKIADIDGRTGSLTQGKDADIAVFTEHPLSISAKVLAVVAEGKRVK